MKTNQIKLDNSILESASPVAKRIARLNNLADFRREFVNKKNEDLTTVDKSKPDKPDTIHHHEECLTTIDRSLITYDKTERIVNKILKRVHFKH